MIEILQKAAEDAGKVLMTYFQNSNLTISQKTSHKNIVTEADTHAQKIVVETILRMMKEKGYSEEEVGFIGEEGLRKEGKHMFIIDPLDGTSNFAAGFEAFAVCISYCVEGETQAGVVYLPTSEKFYIAEKGKGSYMVKGESKIKLEITHKPLQNTLVVGAISSSMEAGKKQFSMYQKLYPHIRGLRITGSTEDFCRIAKNTFGAGVAIRAWIWDISATKLIIEESGGVVIDLEGKQILNTLGAVDQYYLILAGHPNTVEEIQKLIQ